MSGNDEGAGVRLTRLSPRNINGGASRVLWIIRDALIGIPIIAVTQQVT
ncbi:hypothetical protein FACS1894200_11580 [Spirochaetia bacterium]|nr:hypothetical protein FACS1894200_11580 [Spirochaetia bacterium]